jgi:hypothetical protein
VRFGEGAVAQVGHALAELGADRPPSNSSPPKAKV